MSCSITIRARQALRHRIAVPSCRLRADYTTGPNSSSSSGPGCGTGPGCGSSSDGSGSKTKASEYDKRKFQQESSKNEIEPPFDVPSGVPSGVFRCTENECLGPCAGAHKCGDYKNPEYFSYHSMSFADLNVALQRNRLPVPDARRKR
ncbi:hypothetical protein JYU34_003832 [Plutella xylostella]|uniref:NADH dehydrogenase [ubiquinone] flavoprotein 3, mitochondrial n=1 Tax=Plutella xylostella TaxID=51655 RepID=A0ABQ7R129_PLUXY|nr:hypothetical protein JYU34_003832 [Plutella xylostella]